MTLNELEISVSGLISETVTERDSLFLAAANRALTLLFTELPSYKTVELPVTPCETVSYVELLTHCGGERLTERLRGARYSFKVSGEGYYTIRSASGELTREFNTPLSTVHGVIPGGECELIFGGEYSYSIFDLTALGHRPSFLRENTAAVPNGKEICVDDYADNVLALCEKPRDAQGRLINAARAVGHKIIFPEGFSGLATVLCERSPMPIERDTVEIDVDADSASLLPLLTAYFLLLEDDAERAAEYLALFRRATNEKKRRRSLSDTEYLDITGWA